MSRQLYRLYKHSSRFQRFFRKHFTPAGRFFLFITLVAGLFGLNIRRTMIYQLFGISFSLVICAALFFIYFKPRISIRRFLPESCTVDHPLTYRLLITNHIPKPLKGLEYQDETNDDLPSYTQFVTSPEAKEPKRNWFDRRAKYHRWLWLCRMQRGVFINAQTIPEIPADSTAEVKIRLEPKRRGYHHFHGCSLVRSDPFGLIRKLRFFPFQDNLLVLPKIYQVPVLNFIGRPKHQAGTLSAALKMGDSQDFLSLRQYRPGDPLKYIDWKSTARTGKTLVREYQDEHFSRFGLVLDSFTPVVHSEVFEEAVSVAASLFAANAMQDSILDLIFTGPDQFIVSAGRGLADQHHILTILASVATCQNQPFSELKKLVVKHLDRLCGLLVILIDLDKEREELLNELTMRNIPYQALLIAGSRQQAEAKMANFAFPVTILESGNIQEGLHNFTLSRTP